MSDFTRRELVAAFAGTAVLTRQLARAAGNKPAPVAEKQLRGIFPIMITPYTASKAIDYEDLAAQVDYLDRCGAHGMVWPQQASEYTELTKEERMRGMEVIAKAVRGKKPALVLGVQGRNTAEALEYARHAETLEPAAMIAIPPTEAKSLDDFRGYYRALLKVAKRPLFIQTTGGAAGIEPTVEFIVELSRESPNFGYVKEEYKPVLSRMQAASRQRPAIKRVFSGGAGKDLLYEMRLGFDGTMSGAPYADVYAQVWDLYQAGEREKAREIFGKLLCVVMLNESIPSTRYYVMKKRSVFKTTLSRKQEGQLTKEAIEEIEFNYAGLKPYLRT
jgi:dihydrodipicolinate synthase/N-acetylneuraminate lyase